jgi:hypothetical protein
VIAAANIEKTSLAQWGTGGAAATQCANGPVQKFSETLLRASKASPQSESVNDSSTGDARRKKPEDVQGQVVVSGGSAVLIQKVPQQTAPLQQAQVANTNSISSQTFFARVVAPLDASPTIAGQLAGIQPNIAQPVNRSSQPASMLPGAGNQLTNARIEPLSQAGNRAAGADASELQMRPSSFVPTATPKVVANTDEDTTSTSAQSAAATSDQNSIPAAVLNAVSKMPANAVANTDPDTTSTPAQSAAAAIDQNSIPAAVLNAASKMPANAVANTDPDTTSTPAQSATAAIDQNSIPTAVLNAASKMPPNVDAVPVLHAALKASIKGVVASVSAGTSTDEAVPSATAPNQGVLAVGLGFFDSTTSLLASVNQSGGGLPGTIKAGVSSLNSISATKLSSTSTTNGKDTANEVAGGKQQTQSASDQTVSQAGSQSATTSGDQNQNVVTSQGASTAAIQMNFATHTVLAMPPVQNAAVASPALSTLTHAGTGGSSMKTADSAVSVSTAAAPAPPVINSAKLIQNMGQTEMRVGMRSNEFGNISISTSTTRDSISAQISLDHGELAKELAAHLPEMQTKFGSDQAVNVRIEMNGGMAGQGTGTSGGMSYGSSDQSRDGRQQSSNAASDYASSSVVERQMSSAASTTTGYGSLNARLDIRV